MTSYPGDDASETLRGVGWSTGEVGKLQAAFAQRGVKLLALSCNDVDSHQGYTDFFTAFLSIHLRQLLHALFNSEA